MFWRKSKLLYFTMTSSPLLDLGLIKILYLKERSYIGPTTMAIFSPSKFVFSLLSQKNSPLTPLPGLDQPWVWKIKSSHTIKTKRENTKNQCLIEIPLYCGSFCLPTYTVGEESILLGAGEEEVLNITFYTLVKPLLSACLTLMILG